MVFTAQKTLLTKSATVKEMETLYYKHFHLRLDTTTIFHLICSQNKSKESVSPFIRGEIPHMENRVKLPCHKHKSQTIPDSHSGELQRLKRETKPNIIYEIDSL